MTQALYQRVYEELRDAIHAGQFSVGDRFPSEAELTKQFDVSVITLKRALDLLRDDGYIVRRPRLGTFVISDIATSAPASTALRQPLIGCVVTDFDDTFGTPMLAGLLEASNDTLNLLIKRSLGNSGVENGTVRALIAGGVRGLILQPSSSEYVSPALLELVTQSFPVVILDRVFDGVPVSSVCSDNIAAGRLAAEYLFDLGHERVGLVSSASHVSTVDDRLDGFVDAHASRHVPHDPRYEYRGVQSTTPGSTVSPDDDIAELEKFLVANPELTALVATEYNIAVLLREAARRTKRAVPADLAIVCFDHPDAFYDRAQFRFTHIRQDQARMGHEAVRMIVDQLQNPGQVYRAALAVELVPGDSTRQLATGR